MKMTKKLVVVVLLFCLASVADAAYLEDFEAPDWSHNQSISNNTGAGWGHLSVVNGSGCVVKNLSTWLGETDSQVAQAGGTGGAVRVLDVGDIGTGTFEVRAVIRVNVQTTSQAGLVLGNSSLAGDSFPDPANFLQVMARGSNWNGLAVIQYDNNNLVDDAIAAAGVSFADNVWTEIKIVANNTTGAASVWYRQVDDNISATPLEDWQWAYDYQDASYSFTHVGIRMQNDGMLDKLTITPEPVTLAVLGIGGLLMLYRRMPRRR